MTKLKDTQVNLELSKEIYSSLIKGYMINKHCYCPKAHTMIFNPLFAEIEQNYDQYALQYRMAGMTLIDDVNYFYLLEEEYQDKTAIQNKSKIHAAITVLVRYITQDTGKLFEFLVNINYGFTADDLLPMQENPTYKLILERNRLGNVNGLIKTLKERGFIFETKNSKLVLSDSGKKLVDDIIKKNKIESE